MRRYTRAPLLQFDGKQKELTESLSAVVFAGDQLWVASDELTSVERLASDDDGLTYGGHESFPLADFITLPALDTDADQEVDVEGLDVEGSYLWVVGSHSFKRKKAESKKPDEHDDPAKMIAKLAKVDKEGNRFILARIPLVTGDDGRQALAPEGVDARGRPLRAAQLPGDVQSDALTKALGVDDDDARDPHLGKFLKIPGKDNGLDIEGLVVVREKDSEVFKVFLGLRGPVLRGWAVVLVLRPYVDEDEPDRLRLHELDDGRRYRKHVLDLAGLGVRDLCPQGDDLLVLAGPTMDLDGPVHVFRWHGAMSVDAPTVVRDEALTREVDLPYGVGTDHAEGIGLLADGSLLVVYDSPSPERLQDGAVLADVVRLG